MKRENLDKILTEHKKWRMGDSGGICADLRGADLGGADLRGADLGGAYLRGADLGGAYLGGADLRGADLRGAYLGGAYLRGAYLRDADLGGAYLRGAYLRGAYLRDADLGGAYLGGAYLRDADLRDTILDGVEWLAWIGIVPVNGKARSYKLINHDGEGVFQGGINYLLKKKIFSVKNINKDINIACGEGINLATLEWCITNKQNEGDRLLMMEFEVSEDNVVCPMASDGNFRVKKCRRIGECDWGGRLIKNGIGV